MLSPMDSAESASTKKQSNVCSTLLIDIDRPNSDLETDKCIADVLTVKQQVSTYEHVHINTKWLQPDTAAPPALCCLYTNIHVCIIYMP